MQLKDRVVIVTGASSGIGRASAQLLSARGARVALASRSGNRLDGIARALPHTAAIPTDVTRAEEVKRMVARTAEVFGRVDCLVNCAGQGYDAPVELTDSDTLRRIFDLYVFGPLTAMQAVIPLMRAQGGGAIVNVSSGLALRNIPNTAGYAAAKRALVALSLVAREELKGDGISVGIVYPYITDTDFEANTIKHGVRGWEGSPPYPPDGAEFAAGKVIEALETGEAEVFAHEWMRGTGARTP